MAEAGTRFTRADYMRLPEGFPVELIEGELLKMPSPTRRHQQLTRRIAITAARLVAEERLYFAPIDVFVDDYNVLQPDVCLLSASGPDEGTEREIPIPALVVEVLSPSTERRDRETKSAIYLRAGVQEVWLVDPGAASVEVRSAAGRRVLSGGEAARSEAVPEFVLEPAALFRP